MSQDLFSQPETEENHYYSVSEVTKMIQDCLESAFPPLQVRGEISNFVAHASGHWYFTLKDTFCQIRVVMFRSTNQRLGWKPQRGESIEVKIKGQIGVYKARGEYQIICQSMERCGEGALQAEFEKRKEKLSKEGLFERKRPLPFLPHHIAIISSPTGAAIRDILNILKRRYKGVKVTLVPALVQGKQAPESLREALNKAKQLKEVDVLILTRGGGSLEDLWAFNNEELARALFEFPLPVICAVGHEIDFTICDFVSDLRAPTPSAAAELVVKNASDLSEKIHKITSQLYRSFQREVSYLKEKLITLNQSLINPRKKIQDFQQYIDELNIHLKRSFFQQHQLKTQQLNGFISLLESLSPLKILSRGYCLVSKNKKLIKEAKELKKGEEVHIQFSESFALARIFQLGPIHKKKDHSG